MLIAVSLEAASATVSKLLIEHKPIDEILFYRYFSALLILTPFIDKTVLKFSARIIVSHITRSILMVGTLHLYIEALKYTDLATATALLFTYPILTGLSARIAFSERIERKLYGSALTSSVGVLLIFQPGDTTNVEGSLLALAAAATLSLRSLTDRALGLTDISPLSISWIGAALAACVFFIRFDGNPPISGLREINIILFCIFSLTASVMITYVTSKGHWSEYITFGYWQIIATITISHIFFNEEVNNVQLLGCIVIFLSGIILRMTGAQNKNKKSS
ncbi:DMT family transporter [Pontivivens ytuae]|uniref:DMT family transporter n=1 Tax=Pontivivens ytuae TaxID=2789856 RepID=A0A7S9LP77_9RHOB|nr:DMT family transporter [Pontivivens ytuae]QPH52744.1 DMT family transporter [Pontivivens ytuae]